MKIDAQYFENYFKQYAALAHDISNLVAYYQNITNIYDAFGSALSVFFPVEKDEYFVANKTLRTVESILSLTHHVETELSFIRLSTSTNLRVIPAVERTIGISSVREAHGVTTSITYGATSREPLSLINRIFVDESLYCELLLPYTDQWILDVGFTLMETTHWNTLKVLQIPPIVVNIDSIEVGGINYEPYNRQYPHLFQLPDTAINAFKITGSSAEIIVSGASASIIGFTHIGVYYRRYHTYGVFNAYFHNDTDREVSVSPVYYIPPQLYEDYDTDSDIIIVKLYKTSTSPSGFELIWTSLSPTSIILDADSDIYVEVELRGNEKYTPLFYGIKLIEV